MSKGDAASKSSVADGNLVIEELYPNFSKYDEKSFVVTIRVTEQRTHFQTHESSNRESKNDGKSTKIPLPGVETFCIKFLVSDF